MLCVPWCDYLNSSSSDIQNHWRPLQPKLSTVPAAKMRHIFSALPLLLLGSIFVYAGAQQDRRPGAFVSRSSNLRSHHRLPHPSDLDGNRRIVTAETPGTARTASQGPKRRAFVSRTIKSRSHHRLPNPSDSDRHRRIINGVPITDTSEVPWMVRLEIPSKPGLVDICGGSLIDSTHVLTAAHCVYNKPDIMRSAVLLKSLKYFSVNDEDYILRGISDVKTYPKYDPSTGKNNYDVAIVTLNDTVEGLAFVKLAPENAPPYVGKKATVMGWGRTTSEPGPTSSPDNLLKTTITVMPDALCAKRTQMYLPDGSDICSDATAEQIKDNMANSSCKGDSGGPIFVDGVQIAIVSRGDKKYKCGDPKIFFVDSRVSFYRSWIMENSNYKD